MNPTRRSFLATATIGAPLAAHAQHGGHAASALGGGAAAAFAAEMHRQMKAMMEAMAAAPRSGDPDRDFLAMMIPHHQGAIEMARLVLVHGRDPLTRQVAEGIIAAQQAEISSMTERLKLLTSGASPEADGFPALSGTRGN
jgi:uncharacterized protein (DUF305 family)